MGSKAAKQRWKCWATTCPLLFLIGHQWTNYWDRASIFSHLCLSRIFSKKISNNIISYKSNIRAFVSKRYNKSRFVSRLHLELCPFFACRSLSLTVCSSSPYTAEGCFGAMELWWQHWIPVKYSLSLSFFLSPVLLFLSGFIPRSGTQSSHIKNGTSTTVGANGCKEMSVNELSGRQDFLNLPNPHFSSSLEFRTGTSGTSVTWASTFGLKCLKFIYIASHPYVADTWEELLLDRSYISPLGHREIWILFLLHAFLQDNEIVGYGREGHK